MSALTDAVRRFVSRPIAAAVGRLQTLVRFEPVAVAGAVIAGVTILRDALASGVDLETALTGTIIAIGTRILRDQVWPDAKVDSDGVAFTKLEDPITGLDD